MKQLSEAEKQKKFSDDVRRAGELIVDTLAERGVEEEVGLCAILVLAELVEREAKAAEAKLNSNVILFPQRAPTEY